MGISLLPVRYRCLLPCDFLKHQPQFERQKAQSGVIRYQLIVIRADAFLIIVIPEPITYNEQRITLERSFARLGF